jgi:hypothetical protein
VEFEATLDDLVDTNLRLANRTRTFRSSRRRSIWLARILPAAAFTYFRTSYLDDLTPGGRIALVAALIAAGVLFGMVFARYYDWMFWRRDRKMIAELLGDAQTVSGVIELRRDEVWARQNGTQSTFPWSRSAGIEDTGDAVELRFNPGIIVVRNKYFTDAGHRERFLAQARRLSSNRLR